MRKLKFVAVIVVILRMMAAPADAAQATCGPGQLGPGEPSAETTSTTVDPEWLHCLQGKNSGAQVPTVASVPGSAVPNGAAPTKASAEPAKKYVPYNRLGTGPDGKPCATTGYVEEGVAPPDERSLADPNPYNSVWQVLETYPPCPQQPRAPGEPAPVETRAMVAARYWENIPLPKPRPSIAPGRAITGKMAYLETKGEIAHTYTNGTVFGPLTIVAKGSYRVDWGDGTTTGPHSLEGKPWPDGQITHDYINIGAYDVVVTEKWTAAWSLDGESGIPRTLQTTGTIDDFPVEQIQAVIGR